MFPGELFHTLKLKQYHTSKSAVFPKCRK